MASEVGHDLGIEVSDLENYVPMSIWPLKASMS